MQKFGLVAYALILATAGITFAEANHHHGDEKRPMADGPLLFRCGRRNGVSGFELKTLQLRHIQVDAGKIIVRPKVAKNQEQREPILMAIAQWGLRNLLQRAASLGATEPEHYLLVVRSESGTKNAMLLNYGPTVSCIIAVLIWLASFWRPEHDSFGGKDHLFTPELFTARLESYKCEFKDFLKPWSSTVLLSCTV